MVIVIQRFLPLAVVMAMLFSTSPLMSVLSAPLRQPTLSPTLRLNEVVPVPVPGEDEWVELVNLGAASVSLAGWKIDDADHDGADPYALPDIVLAPGAYLRIVTPSMFSNLGSDDVRLLDPAGDEADRYTYDSPQRGRVYGRIPDGNGAWQADLDPTPGSPNAPASTPPTPSATAGGTPTTATSMATPTHTPAISSTPALEATVTATAPPQHTATETPISVPTTTATSDAPTPEPSGVRLNEIAAAGGQSGAAGWFEVYNIGSAAVNLGNWRVSTQSGSVGTLPDKLRLGAGEWMVVMLPAGFVAVSDTLTLKDTNDTVADRFGWDRAVPGRSWCRIPDGIGPWVAERPLSQGVKNIDVEPATQTGAATLTPTSLPSATRTATATTTPSAVPSATATRTTKPTATATSTRTPTPTRTSTVRPTPTSTRTPSATRTASPTRTPSPTKTSAPTRTPSPTRTSSPTRTPSPTKTPAPTRTLSPTRTSSPTRTPSPTRTSSPTRTATITRTVAPTRTPSPTRTKSPTRTPTLTRTPVPTRTPTLTRTPVPTRTPSPTRTLAPSRTPSPTRTASPTKTASPTRTPTAPVVVPSPAAVTTRTPSAIHTPRATRTPSPTKTPSPTRTVVLLQAETAQPTSTTPPRVVEPAMGQPTGVEAATPTLATITDTDRPTQAIPGSVLIDEVLYDPPAPLPDPDGEWLVLRNTGATSIVLRGWTIRDGDAASPLPPITVAAGERVLILAAEADGVENGVDLRVALDGRIGNGLRNGGDSVWLIDGTGSVVDAVSWGDDASAFNPPVPSVEGRSIRRTGPRDTDTAQDWLDAEPPTPQPASPPRVAEPVVVQPFVPDQTTGDSSDVDPTTTADASAAFGGMPAVVTVPSAPLITRAGDVVGSSFGNVIISEVAPHGRWVELYNRGPDVVDVSDWTLNDTSSSSGLLLQSATLLPVHGLIVFDTPELQMTGATPYITLRRPDGMIVDSVYVGPVEPSRSWSRFPVHGGAWTANTTMSKGQLNLSAPEPVVTPTSQHDEPPTRTAAPIDTEEAAPGDVVSVPVALWLLGATVVGAVIWLARRRP